MNLLRKKCDTVRIRKGIIGLILLGLSIFPSSLMAEGGSMIVKDPMIKITSLPTKLDVHDVLTRISKDVSRETGLDETLITYFWQTFDDIYCPGCKGAGIEGGITFVDLYVPVL